MKWITCIAILMEYLESVEKYSNIAKAKYLTHTIDRSPLYAGKRITYEKFGEALFRSREIKEAFDVLERALTIYRARPSTLIKLPVIEKMRKAPKLFFLDAGLTVYCLLQEIFFYLYSMPHYLLSRLDDALDQLIKKNIDKWVLLLPVKSIPVDFKYSGGFGFIAVTAFQDNIIDLFCCGIKRKTVRWQTDIQVDHVFIRS
jgi:hypothetical protein